MKFAPDYHAGADETAMVWALYPDKVDAKAASELKPQKTFAPLGYVGDPASFRLGDGPAWIEALAGQGASAVEGFLKRREEAAP